MARKRPGKIVKVLAEAKALLGAQYANRLKGIVLFGSYARGDFTEGPDIDLLVCRGLFPTQMRSEHIFPAICDLSLKHDVVLSLVLMDFDAFRSRMTPLVLNAGKEGVWL